ncbi:MAG: NADP-dependent oxidoreductase [Oligoflexia bacterium]|nr:NADP-dependent oxidoreductase [Oligoflexia bacterium]MBF0367550.1 NADP-dependent oxidoreductase [Oligoflexia bacterium]
MSTTNGTSIQQIILHSRPSGAADLSHFRLEKSYLPSTLQEEEVRVQGVYYSVDPYMRGRMNEAKSYIAPFELHKPIIGGVVATVMESSSRDFKKGDFVLGMLPWATEAIVSARDLQKLDSQVNPLSLYLGVLGMPGLTAYFGLLDIARPQANETVVVSGAAGAVGAVVGQLAKLHGCKVVGIVGSDEKAQILKDKLSFDECINYKKVSNIAKAIQESCAKGVDIYFDNVGGEISDSVIKHSNPHGRVVVCGQISLYNEDLQNIPLGPRLLPMVLIRSLLVKGFIISHYQKRFHEGMDALGKLVREGKIKPLETVMEGFEQLPQAFMGLFSGKNIGKMVVKT